jgi:hypothetical protein
MTLLAMIVPTGDPGVNEVARLIGSWGDLPYLHYSLRVERGNLNEFDMIVESLLGTMSTIPFVAGLVMWFLCGRGLKAQVPKAFLLVAGVLVTAGTGYVVFLFFFPVMWLLWIPHVLLFLAALTLMDGWHRRKTVLCVFWPGTFLVTSACVTWCFTVYLIASFLTLYSARFSDWKVPAIWGASMIGSAMSAVGWLLWWRAVRRHLKLNP